MSSEDELKLIDNLYLLVDQFGNIKTETVIRYAQTHLGIKLPNIPIQLNQTHIDMLVKAEYLFDVKPLIDNAILKYGK
jgi:hypothetical protein